MALALRLFLPLLLAVALHARAAQAAPVPARGADEGAGNSFSAAWLEGGLDSLGPPAGVSAGRTFPASGLVPPHKAGSHRRGPPRGRNRSPGDKPSQEALELLDQMLSKLQRRRDEDTGNASPAAWMEDTLGPLGSPAGVSAGRTFPAPGLVAPRWSSSHHRGPPRGRNQPPGDKPPQKAQDLLDQMLNELERRRAEDTRNASPAAWMEDTLGPSGSPAGVSAGRTFPAPLLIPLHKPSSHGREMDQGAVQKLMFPEGSSGSVPGSAEGREAMPGTGTRDENTGNASPLDWLRKVLGPLQPAAITGVSAGRTFPAAVLVVPYKLNSHHRGPPGGKSQHQGEKKSQEPSEGMRQMLKEMLQAGPEMDQGALWQAAFPEGSSGSVPGSAEGREAMPGTGTRDEDTGNASPLDWLHEVLGPLMSPAGVSAWRTFPAPLLVVPHKPSSHGPPRGKNPPPGEKKSQEPSEGMREILNELGRGQDAAGATTRAPKIQESTGRDFCQGTHCLIVIMASMLGGLLVIMSCCAGIWYWRVRKRQESSLAPAPEQPNTSGRKSRTSHLHSLYPCSAALPRLQHLLFDVKVQLPPKRSSLPLNPLIAPYDED
ncbi:uncharacterized protein LOC127473534 isoform X26 [Manacus candei]|uniref:uncharacterized protein LOC127473534 isoform X24 n=1 Tax=Manacus candei TaxID=415023 RepID=UPI00222713BA|nr:uncharacterized protein LOC127473534 isoform X24 [Manacus candei]XP_051649238.1 uncharacterized protein LOC127473534 isoform X25 [Manacus candei]XP_051649239.1 uncharacterized protein LOC127473534 isoform X26 [Manacus candei]